MVIIGIDEAGYGPTLGPLVIGGSLWRIPDDESVEPFAVFKQGFECPSLGRIRLDDSKRIYSPFSGIGGLEAGCFASLILLGNVPVSFAQLFQKVTATELNTQAPWYRAWKPPLTAACAESLLEQLFAATRNHWSPASAELLHVAARVVEPTEYNQLCDRFGNKATLLTETSLELVAQLLERESSSSVAVACDKHGGRNRYAAPLLQRWPEARLQVIEERRAGSRYRMQLADGQQITWTFTAKGDAYAPTSLASMWAKYLRERLMEPFNAFWIRQLPDLKPTAGYPQDAVRFLESIDTTRQRLGIELSSLKRCR